MCRPDHFDVTYSINPWMDPSTPTDRAVAVRQWEDVRATYERLGHTVSLVDPAPGLPDMVFTANAGFAIGDTVLLSRFRHAERHDETPLAHEQLADVFGLPVVTLELADPRWYHLDTAFAAVTNDLVAWYPRAFTPDSQRQVMAMFPNHLVASEHDANEFGVNLVSDGSHVLVAAQATRLIGQLEAHGLAVHPVDVSEFKRSGGGIKCITLALHDVR